MVINGSQAAFGWLVRQPSCPRDRSRLFEFKTTQCRYLRQFAGELQIPCRSPPAPCSEQAQHADYSLRSIGANDLAHCGRHDDDLAGFTRALALLDIA